MTLFERRLRLGTGLFLAVYIVLHLSNHALGLISYDVMEGVRELLSAVWRNVVINTVLYLCLLIHFLLALRSLYRRTTLKMSRWEFAQLALGLSIIPLLAAHATANWGARVLLDLEVDYYFTISGISSNSWYVVRQLLLVLVAWIHVCMGLHFWLRMKPWYKNWLPVIYGFTLLIPVLSLIAVMQISFEISDDDFLDTYGYTEEATASIEPVLTPVELKNLVLIVFYGLLVLTLLARWARFLIKSQSGSFKVVHPSGRSFTGIKGPTILEVLRRYGVPHASVCGGRGRCTTCRVRVVRGIESCPQPNPLEQQALTRIGAQTGVRLACQTTPTRDVHITPLVSVHDGLGSLRRPGSVQGTESNVVAMFVDLRGSTRMAEKRLPYDVLFILNRFFAEMTEALQETRGHYAQFAGDGLMALYGLNTDLRSGCRDALSGAVKMQSRIDRMNEYLKEELDEPLRIGIGVHCGEAIVGTMGPPDAPNYSAIGDNINAAARLEALTKEFDVSLIVSKAVVSHAGYDLAGVSLQSVAVRGKSRTLDIYAVNTDVIQPFIA